MPLPPPTLTTAGSNNGGKLQSKIANLSLPPLAAVGGVLYSSQILPHLKPLQAEIHAAIEEGKEVVLIKALSSPATSRDIAIKEREDLVTFMDHALRNDPLLRSIKIIHAGSDNNAQFQELVMRVTDADEVKTTDRKYIILMTNSCLEGVCSNQLAVETFLTKLNRAHFGKIKILTAPAKEDHDILQLWSANLLNASTDPMRELLLQAALKPENHPMSGVYQALRKPFPANDDSGLISKYPEQYPIFLQVLQSMFWNPSPMALVLWGKPSTGKSTLIRGAANLLDQCGLGSNYILLRDGKVRVEGTDNNFGLGFSPTRLLTCIDQIDHGAPKIDINMTGQFQSNHPAWKVLATSNLTPDELFEKLGPNLCLNSLQFFKQGDGEKEVREPILQFSLRPESCYRLGEGPSGHQLSNLATPTTFSHPTVVFLRWEEAQWNIDPELIDLAKYLLSPS